MENELNISLDGITNINDVSNFSMKLEILAKIVQRHTELRELCHREFLRRMENVMSRRRSLLERRRMRQKMENTRVNTDEFQDKITQTKTAEESVVKLNDSSDGKTDKTTDVVILPDITKANLDLIQKQRKKKGKAVEFEDNQNPRVQHNINRRKSRNSTSSNGSKSSGKARGRFRKISLAVGGAVRISSKRRNTYPVEGGGLFVGKSPKPSPNGKIVESKSVSPGSSLNDVRSNATSHSNRGEPHLAITRQAINTNARRKIKDIVTRVKVVKTFQGSVRKDETKISSVRFHEQK